MHTHGGPRFGWISFSSLLAASLTLAALVLPLRAVAQGATGAVEGRVYDVATGLPLAGVEVSTESGALRRGLTAATGASTSDAEGRYRIEGLEPGTHRFYVYRPAGGYIGQIYSGVSCPFPGASYGSSCDDLLSTQTGTPVSVTAGETTTEIDFPLEKGGEITGRVTDAETGLPIRARVVLLPQFGDLFVSLGSVFADGDGRYRFQALPGGTYEVLAYDNQGYVESEAVEVSVALGGEAVLDIALQPNTTVSGRVFDEGSGDGVDAATVRIFDALGDIVGEAPTTTDGTYAFGHLENGTYYLKTFAGFDRPWVDQLYGGIICGFYEDCDVTTGTPVVIAGGTSVTDIDFPLTIGGRISGTILAGTEPILDVVSVFSSTGQFLFQTNSSPEDGSYTAQGLAEGTYYLVAIGLDKAPILYDGLPCGPDGFHLTCDVTTGTAIPVVLEETTPGIDFTFPVSRPGACAPTASRLCLNNGRFEVEMSWETQLSEFGRATAVDLPSSDDSGYFYFFSPDNVEVVVKVLDACQTSFNRFWVFAAGLTNLRVDMTVTDTISGEVRTYVNPLQTPFQPLLDTRAFETCDAVAPGALGGGEQGGAAEPSPWPGLILDDQDFFSSPEPADAPIIASAVQESAALRLLAPAPASVEGTCVADATSLCLQGGRFRVEAEYRTPDTEGHAMSQPLTDDTGVFYFFNSDNLEIIVKVLSNCNGPSNRFWVFAGGLTNLEVTLTVTDTLTGAVKTYVNPQRTAFQPIQDTRAFDTCGAS